MKIKFKRKVLKNGITVLFEKRKSEIVSVAYAVRYGGINESENEKGIAHFIEHMIYKGNKKRGAKEIAEAFERKGGIMNGFTEDTFTAFWVKAPKRHFFEMFRVLTEMIKNPAFDATEMEKERKVIFEEIKMREENPKEFVLNKIYSSMFSSPFGLGTIGKKETLLDIDREKIVRKFQEVYIPQNIFVSIVGDVEFGSVCKFIENNFEKKLGKTTQPNIFGENKAIVMNRSGINQTSLVLAFHSPKSDEKEKYAAYILSCLMGNGMSSRLFSEIRMKRNLAYDVGTNYISEKKFGLTLVYAGTSFEKMEEVKGIIINEFKKASKNISKKEFDSVKDQIIGNFLVSQDDSRAALEKILYFEAAECWKDITDFEENIRKVRLKDVKKLAEKAFDKYGIFALVPG